jgi:hypothetical protein
VFAANDSNIPLAAKNMEIARYANTEPRRMARLKSEDVMQSTPVQPVIITRQISRSLGTKASSRGLRAQLTEKTTTKAPRKRKRSVAPLKPVEAVAITMNDTSGSDIRPA